MSGALISSESIVAAFGGGQCISTCRACGKRIEGFPPRDGDTPVFLDKAGEIYHQGCLPQEYDL